MPTRVTTAVIPAAGLGTRFLPATKSTPKEMLPLIDKPAIQYVVEEAVRCGITNIVIVTGRGKASMEDHFDRSFELEHHLKAKGKTGELAEMLAIAELAEIHYVRQGEPLGLGHAVSMARRHVGDQSFAVMLGDDIMHERSPVLAKMIATSEERGASVLALKEVLPEEISAYGAASVDPAEDGVVRVRNVVEKPVAGQAPSNLAVIGRYVLTPGIFDALERITPGAGGELQLTDAIKLLIDDEPVYGWTFSEGRYDVGNKIDYLKATVELALERPDLGPPLRAFLQELLGSVIPYAQARQRVVGSCPPLPAERVPLARALGRVLAESVVAADNVPPFANTAMDGYAVRAADVAEATAQRPARLAVIGTLAAGAAPSWTVGAGQALRIMTGAPFPPGADAIAIVELTEAVGDDVLVRAPAVAGEHIRHPGEDLPAGVEVFAAGELLGPGHLGVLASAGLSEVVVGGRPRVGVLSTGDELVESGPLGPGQIRDSNRASLLALVARDGFEPVDLGIARDEEAAIHVALQEGVARCDALLTSGGVSMGDFDYVKKVLDQMGDMSWMQVAIRPAKPLAFGVVGTTPVFGLPGNPVSSTVSYELFARPALRRMSGHGEGEWDRSQVRGIADESFGRRTDGRVSYVRVRAHFESDGRCHVRSTGGQGSHQLRAMALANALAIVPDGVAVGAGEECDIMLLD